MIKSIETLFKSAILALGVLGFASTPALADEYIGGDISVDLNTDEEVAILAADIEVTGRIGGEFAAAGAEIMIDATFEDDFAVAGADVYVAGEIAGDAAFAGAEVSVLANILGDAAIFGADVTVSGFIGGELAIAGADVTLDASSVVTGPMEVKARRFEADGRVIGDVTIEAERITIRGVFEGPIEIYAREVVIGPEAVITGPITVRSPTPPVIEDGAQVGGFDHIQEAWDESRIDNWDFQIENVVLPSVAFFGAVNAALAFLVGLLVAALFPQSMARMSGQFRQRPLVSTGLGLIIWATAGIILLILMSLVAATVVGILLIPFFLLAIPVIYYLSFVFGGVVIGDRIFNRSGERVGYAIRALSLLAVMAVIGILSLIGEVGWFFILLSWLLVYIVSFIGFGAWTLTIFNRQPQGHAAEPTMPGALEGDAV